MTQCEAILDYMENHDNITQRDALNHLGCARLASRICDLRKKGYDISEERIIVRCRGGRRARVSAYSLEES